MLLQAVLLQEIYIVYTKYICHFVFVQILRSVVQSIPNPCNFREDDDARHSREDEDSEELGAVPCPAAAGAPAAAAGVDEAQPAADSEEDEDTEEEGAVPRPAAAGAPAAAAGVDGAQPAAAGKEARRKSKIPRDASKSPNKRPRVALSPIAVEEALRTRTSARFAQSKPAAPTKPAAAPNNTTPGSTRKRKKASKAAGNSTGGTPAVRSLLSPVAASPVAKGLKRSATSEMPTPSPGRKSGPQAKRPHTDSSGKAAQQTSSVSRTRPECEYQVQHKN